MAVLFTLISCSDGPEFTGQRKDLVTSQSLGLEWRSVPKTARCGTTFLMLFVSTFTTFPLLTKYTISEQSFKPEKRPPYCTLPPRAPHAPTHFRSGHLGVLKEPRT